MSLPSFSHEATYVIQRRLFSYGSVVKESTCGGRSCRRSQFDSWVGKMSWRRKRQPMPYSCLGNPHGHRSLVGFSPSVTSVQFSHSVVSNSLQPHGLQHTRPPCPSPTPGVYANSCQLSCWCHLTSVVPFFSCSQSFPASGSSQMSQLFASGGQSIGVSASTWEFQMNTQDWSPLGWTGWSSLQSKGLSRVFSITTVQKHQFFDTQLSSQSNSHIHTWPLEKP